MRPIEVTDAVLLLQNCWFGDRNGIRPLKAMSISHKSLVLGDLAQCGLTAEKKVDTLYITKSNVNVNL